MRHAAHLLLRDATGPFRNQALLRRSHGCMHGAPITIASHPHALRSPALLCFRCCFGAPAYPHSDANTLPQSRKRRVARVNSPLPTATRRQSLRGPASNKWANSTTKCPPLGPPALPSEKATTPPEMDAMGRYFGLCFSLPCTHAAWALAATPAETFNILSQF